MIYTIYRNTDKLEGTENNRKAKVTGQTRLERPPKNAKIKIHGTAAGQTSAQGQNAVPSNRFIDGKIFLKRENPPEPRTLSFGVNGQDTKNI